MTRYGILVVDPAWRDQTSAVLDKATVQHHRKELVNGTHALIYVKEPVEAIVAEAVVSGDLLELDTAPPDPTSTIPVALAANTERGLNIQTTPENPPDPIGSKHEFGVNYAVPLEVKRPKLLTTPISINRIKALLGEDFAVFDEEWLPLNEADYRKLTSEWTAE